MATSIALYINLNNGLTVSVSFADKSGISPPSFPLPAGPDFCDSLRECVKKKNKISVYINGKKFKDISSLKEFDEFFKK
jgi:hypothetical protein